MLIIATASVFLWLNYYRMYSEKCGLYALSEDLSWPAGRISYWSASWLPFNGAESNSIQLSQLP